MKTKPIGTARLTALSIPKLTATYTVDFDIDLVSPRGLQMRAAAAKMSPCLGFELDESRQHMRISVPREQYDELTRFTVDRTGSPFVLRFDPSFCRRYKPVRELGKGAMGVTQEAVCARTGRRVAVKTLKDGGGVSASDLRRFEREVRYMASLNTPFVVQVLDFELKHNDRWLSMELAPNGSLAGLLKDNGKRMGVHQALEIHRQIALGLDGLHKPPQGPTIVHRDVKPDNILLWGDLAKLADLGQAIQVESLKITSPKEIVGTIRYMSPEQLKDAHEVTYKTDIYSLGVSLFESLGGSLPPGGAASAKGVGLFRNGQVVALATTSDEGKILGAVERLILRMVAQNPEARPDASEVASEIARIHP